MMKEGGKERGAPGGQKTPQLGHEVNTCWSIFIYPNTCVSSNPIFSESSSLSFSFLGGLLSLVGVHNAPSCVLALYGTYRVHAKKMKSGQGVEGVYWVMSWVSHGRCFESLDAEASANNLMGSSHGRFSSAASASIPAPLSTK